MKRSQTIPLWQISLICFDNESFGLKGFEIVYPGNYWRMAADKHFIGSSRDIAPKRDVYDQGTSR